MKKSIALTIACILCFSVVAVGLSESEFTLRNGIKFGDTIDDILLKETSLTRSSETSNSFTGKIAGYDDAECTFRFDDDGKLRSMEYGFSESCYSRESTNDVYKKLYQSLVRQYGSAEGNTGGTVELITGPAISSMSLRVYLFGELDGYDGDYYDYDEWTIDTDSYHVKIDLISYYYRDDDYEYYYYVNLSYYMFTDEEYNAEIDKKVEEQGEVDDDL